MHMIFDKKIYEKRLGWTLSPHNYIPMIITSKESADRIQKGEIEFQPFVKDRELIGKKVKEKYQESSNCFIDLSDLNAIGLGVIPLVYEKGRYIKPGKKLLDLGECAILITDPFEFRLRLEQMINIMFPNYRYLEIASAQYKNMANSNIEDWNLYNRPENERWKKEILICARIQPDIAVNSYNVEACTLNIGDLSDISICIDTHDLVKGKLPDNILTEEYKMYMESFTPKLQGIQGIRLTVAGNIVDISPIEKWIDYFYTIIDPEQWIPITVMEKIRVDGAALPRLVFRHKNRMDSIRFGINQIEFNFNLITNKEWTLIKDIIDNLASKLNTGYCIMSMEMNANLGTVIEGWALKKSRVCDVIESEYKGLYVSQFIETDGCLSHNIFGITTMQKAWHYCIKVQTPGHETIPYYNAENVLEFYHNTSEYCEKVINKLMGGNIYAKFSKMQKYR